MTAIPKILIGIVAVGTTGIGGVYITKKFKEEKENSVGESAGTSDPTRPASSESAGQQSGTEQATTSSVGTGSGGR